MKAKELRVLVKALVTSLFTPFCVSAFFLSPVLRRFVRYDSAFARARKLLPLLALLSIFSLALLPVTILSMLDKWNGFDAWQETAALALNLLSMLSNAAFRFLVSKGMFAALVQKNRQETAAQIHRVTLIGIALTFIMQIFNLLQSNDMLDRIRNADIYGGTAGVALIGGFSLALLALSAGSIFYHFYWVYQFHKLRLTLTVAEYNEEVAGYDAAAL